MEEKLEKLLVAYDLKFGGNELGSVDPRVLTTFLLQFNLFESFLFGRKGNVQTRLIQICEDLKQVNEPLPDLAMITKCFVSRYVDDKDAKQNFKNLKLADNEVILDGFTVKGKVLDILTHAKDRKPYELVWAYLSIAYRFRNSLFHGSKNVLSLHKYSDCFIAINEFMHDLLCYMVDTEFIGLEKKYTRRGREQ